MNAAKVTIGIPTLNRAHYLSLALDSALRQTYTNLEIVVSDNASSDETAALLGACTDPRVKVLRQPSTLSMVGNWNACLEAATGEYFLLLSDDDLLEPEAIAGLIGTFEGAPDPQRVGFVYCRGRVIDSAGRFLREGQMSPATEDGGGLVHALLEGKRDTWPCSILLRRSDMLDGYSSDFVLITDAAMWVRALARHGTALFVNRFLVNYRIHQNLTATTPAAVWQQDNVRFVEFAVRTLTDAKLMDAPTERAIRESLRRLNVQLAIYVPFNNPGKTVLGVLRAYGDQLPQIFGWYGASLLARVLIRSWVSGWRYVRATVAAKQR